MAEDLKKFEFILVYDVLDGNPNGDPLAGNRPRMDNETGQGLASDVCLKYKVREYIRNVKGGTSGIAPEPGYDLFVKPGEPLNVAIGNAAERALEAVNEGSSKKETLTMQEFRTPNFTSKDKELKDLKWKKIYRARKLANQYLSEKFVDIRLFGGMVSTGGYHLPVMKGAFQVCISRTLDKIDRNEIKMTRCVATGDEEDNERDGDDDTKIKERTFGSKHIVSYGLYMVYGFFNPNRAIELGTTKEDVKLLKDALAGGMWEFDRSSGRGFMATRKFIVFEHDQVYGSCNTADLVDLVTIKRKGGVEYPRSFRDYDVIINRDGLPDGVKLDEIR